MKQPNYTVYYNITITEEGRQLWLEAGKKEKQRRALLTPEELREKHQERIFGSEYVRIKKDMAYAIQNGVNNPDLPMYLEVMKSQLNKIKYELPN